MMFYPGDCVEVVDPSHRLHGRCGTVAYLVSDNIHVRFARTRWLPTRVLFPEQLRLTAVVPVARKTRVADIGRPEPAT